MDPVSMLKTVIFGFLLGIVGTVAAAYYVPVVDQHRESSVISVAPNGGNRESFRINIPADRIMVGAPKQAEPLPPADSDAIEDSVEWVLHLPARGTLYVAMPVQVSDGARRVGALRAGTREFGRMQGKVSERWVPITDNDDIDAPDGYIELETSFVGTFSDDVTETALQEGAL